MGRRARWNASVVEPVIGPAHGAGRSAGRDGARQRAESAVSDDSAQTSPPNSEPESRERYAINPAGFALVLLGAALAVIATFLPRAESTAFSLSGIEKNTLLQSGGGIEVIIGAVVLALVAYSAWTNGRRSGAILIVSACLIGWAFYQGSGSRIALYRINPDGSQGAQVNSSAGIGIYAVGVGGFLGLVGGWVIRRSSPLVSDVAPAAATNTDPTKRCPDCAETVLAAARVCKHCGHRFEDPHDADSAKLVALADALKEEQPSDKPRRPDSGSEARRTTSPTPPEA